MKTIKIIALAAALTASMPAFAQETQRLTANKHNEYGLIYSLPKTHVNIEVEAVRTVKKAGPYYRYAEKYLGVKNPITEDSQTWAVKDVQMSAFGVPDKDSEWLMNSRQGRRLLWCSTPQDCRWQSTPTPNAKWWNANATRWQTRVCLTEQTIQACLRRTWWRASR